MPSLGPAEILVILVVALLVFGPNKMPEIGRQLARGVREFRKVRQHLSSELRGVVSEFDLGDSDHDDDTTAAPSPPRPGGDPVPKLPAKASDPASGTTAADGADGADGVVEAGTPRPASEPSPSDTPSASNTSSASNTQSPPDRVLPQIPEAVANGESPPAQPSDST